MIANKNIRFAIIGYGHIGQRYADLIAKQNSALLVAVVDEKSISTSSPVPFYHNIENLLQEGPAFDIAIIATPNGLHAQHAIQCLQYGKDVIIEKPIALNVEDVASIYHVAKEKGRQIFPVFQNRFAPTSIWLKQIVNEGLLGKLFMVQVNCYWNRGDQYYKADHWHGTRELDGGTLYTQFSHFIDMLLWLFGPITNVQSRFFNFNHQNNTQFEDSGLSTFSFEKGGEGSFNFSTSIFDQNFESSILIIGEKGTIKVGGQYMEKVVYQHTQATLPAMKDSNASNHQLFLNDVVRRVENRLGAPINQEDASLTIEAITKIYG